MLSILHAGILQSILIFLFQETILQLFFCVNGFAGHGGWADRLKGIVSTYNYCKKNGINFRLWYDFPYELSEFLLPNKVNWKISQGLLRFNPLIDRVAILTDSEESLTLSDKIKNKNFRKIFVYYNIDDIKNETIWKKLFFDLFEVNESLITRAKSELAAFPKPWNAVIFRFLGLFGDFMRSSYTIQGETKKLQVASHYYGLLNKWRDSEPIAKKGTVFLFSDSDFFLTKSGVFAPWAKVITKGDGRSFIHQRLSPERGRSVMERTLLDFLRLSLMENQFIFSDGRFLWESGFVKYSSYMGNTVYFIINIPPPLENISDLYVEPSKR